MKTVLIQIPRILSLATPMVMGLAASTLIGVTDSIMLAPLGPIPLAAVGLTNAVALLFYSVIYGIISALSVRIGTAWGAGEGRAISGILRSGLILGLLIGAVSAAVMAALLFFLPLLKQPADVIEAIPSYWLLISAFLIPFSVLTAFKSAFEAVERPWLGTGFAFLAVAINVPLNYALIWGIGPFPALGLTGAGLASLLAEALSLAVALLWWRFAPSMRRLRLRRRIDARDMGRTLREGAPLGAMYVIENASVSVATFMIGSFGTIALAGNQVAQSIGGLLYMLPLGVAGAVAIRVAQERGAGNIGALRPIALAAVLVAILWLTIAALFLAFRGEAIARLVISEPEVVALAASIFLVFAPMQVCDAVQSSMLGALRGLSDTIWPAAVSALAYWPIALPLGWFLAHHGGMGPSGVWAGFIVALFGASVALTIRFWHETAKIMSDQ